MVGQYLKRADQFIKRGDFDAADREVGFALKEEPSNIYALAYRERIHRARIEHENEVREAEERRVADEIYRQHEKELAEEKLRKQRESQEKLAAAVAAAGYVPPSATPAPPHVAQPPYQPSGQYPPAQAPPGQYQPLPAEYYTHQGSAQGSPAGYPPGQYPPQYPAQYPTQYPQQFPGGLPPAGPAMYPQDRASHFSGGRLELQSMSARQQYRDMVMRAWRSGVPTEQDFDLLERARLELNISPEEAGLVHMEVKAESYINAIKVAWRQKRIIPTQQSAFEEFRQRYAVTGDEHMQWEARIMWELQLQQKHETVFYIDDDIGLTEVIEETLQDAGYKTIIATSPEEALAKLRNIIPDLILCDVRFPNSQLNGLTIYEEVRKMPQFTMVPFLFLSAVTDDHIMHAGLGSGADDYITKPFNPDTLLAIIEGKLKRYKDLKQRRSG